MDHLRLYNIFSKRYLKSWVLGFFMKEKFSKIETYCMFIGYQRSGHSYLGALLDAHPNIIMAMEADALHLIKKGYNRNQLYYLLMDRSRYFTKYLNNIWTGYSYAIPDTFQGKYTIIKAIGDKKGSVSTEYFGMDEKLIDKLKQIVQCKIKILHVIRNPFDNISSMTIRHWKPDTDDAINLLMKKIDLYFKKVEINNTLKKGGKLEILDVYHEQFIEKPFENFKKILDFININATDEFIQKCIAKTYKTPHYSRFEINWPGNLKEYVQKKIDNYPFLKHYTFDRK